MHCNRIEVNKNVITRNFLVVDILPFACIHTLDSRRHTAVIVRVTGERKKKQKKTKTKIVMKCRRAIHRLCHCVCALCVFERRTAGFDF